MAARIQTYERISANARLPIEDARLPVEGTPPLIYHAFAARPVSPRTGNFALFTCRRVSTTCDQD
jgi:hypothetical protein